MSKTAKKIIGIDTGTGTTELSSISGTGRAIPVQFPEGGTVCKSVVYFQGEEPIFGSEADNLMRLDPANGVRHWKRSIGKNDVLHTTPSGCEHRAKDIAVLVLKHCKNAAEINAGEIYDAAIITTPANWTDNQNDEILWAAKKAGFTYVELQREPTSALFSYIANHDREVIDGIRVVLDLGEGTVDISVLETTGHRNEVKATNGIQKLGGLDFTQALVDYFLSDLHSSGGKIGPGKNLDVDADLWRNCEDAKVRLNRSEKVTISIVADDFRHQTVVTQDAARQLWKPLTDDLLKCLQVTLDELSLKKESVIELVTVGGASKLKAFQEELEKFFVRPISIHPDPIHAVANGAALYGWELLGEVKIDRATILPARGKQIRNVTAHALGVKALDDQECEHFTQILRKGVPIPSIFEETFRLDQEGQTECLVEVYQGNDGQPINECTRLGEFELTGLPPIFGRPHKIQIELRIDRNGMLTAIATDTESGKSADLQLAYRKESAA